MRPIKWTSKIKGFYRREQADVKRSPISLDLKLQAVTEYLNGQFSQEACADKYGVSDMTIRNWLRKYKINGVEGMEFKGILGDRRMQLHLGRRYGLRVNKKRVYRVMRAIGLQSAIRRKRPGYVKATPEALA